jgi:hypothetical protein
MQCTKNMKMRQPNESYCTLHSIQCTVDRDHLRTMNVRGHTKRSLSTPKSHFHSVKPEDFLDQLRIFIVQNW